MHIDQLKGQLAILNEQILTVNFDEKDIQAVQDDASRLTVTLGVLGVLANTAAWLWKSNEDEKGYLKRSASHQLRVEKMTERVFGDDASDDQKFVALSSLDITTFLFIAASYTPQNFQKLDRKSFTCLMDIAPRYLALHSPSSDWLHRKEFQLAVTKGASPKSTFKRKYQELEYEQEYEGLNAKSAKRLQLDLLGCPTRQWIRDIEERVDEMVGLETAFELPKEVFEEVRTLYSLDTSIMTIPTRDCVGSILHIVQREDAIHIGNWYNLRKLQFAKSEY